MVEKIKTFLYLTPFFNSCLKILLLMLADLSEKKKSVGNNILFYNSLNVRVYEPSFLLASADNSFTGGALAVCFNLLLPRFCEDSATYLICGQE